MAPHYSNLAWKIPWTEEPGRLQSMEPLRVRHDWATSLLLFTFMYWRRKWQPTPGSCQENPRDGGAWWAAVYGVAQSRTRLKQLSSSSSSTFLYTCPFPASKFHLSSLSNPLPLTVLWLDKAHEDLLYSEQSLCPQITSNLSSLNHLIFYSIVHCSLLLGKQSG